MWIFCVTPLRFVTTRIRAQRRLGAHVKRFTFEQMPTLINFAVCNPCYSSPSLAILVPLLLIITLVFFYLRKLFFSCFYQFMGNFVQTPQLDHAEKSPVSLNEWKGRVKGEDRRLLLYLACCPYLVRKIIFLSGK